MKTLKILLKCSVEVVDSLFTVDCCQPSISDEGFTIEPHGVGKTPNSIGNDCYIAHLRPQHGSIYRLIIMNVRLDCTIQSNI
ncbi:hypothetical protein C4Y83_008670 [Klebsiella pneumoniae subsp. pneumoniae]|nr:hypothetical protein C4Y83_008670 [Klebsiella pneumoniae subsp. pneumoniae]